MKLGRPSLRSTTSPRRSARACVSSMDARFASGGSARVQLRLSEPLAAAPGDRFVLRRLSPVETIGGGVVLDPLWPPVGRRRAEERPAPRPPRDAAMSPSAPSSGSSRRGSAAPAKRISRRAPASRPRRSEPRWRPRSRPAASTRCAGRRSATSPKSTLALLAERASAEIAAYLARAGASVGMPRGTLLGRLLPGAEPGWAEAIESALAARGSFDSPATKRARPAARISTRSERDLSALIVKFFRERGLDPPSPAEVVCASPSPPEGGRRPARLPRQEGRSRCGCRAAGSCLARPSTASSASSARAGGSRSTSGSSRRCSA